MSTPKQTFKCTICNNLSDYCTCCGGTKKSNRKYESDYSVCPTCHNQSDYCMTCGGNVRNSQSQEEREEDDAWSE